MRISPAGTDAVRIEATDGIGTPSCGWRRCRCARSPWTSWRAPPRA
ncbi:hypothetical protein NKH77_05780 [Streptomyces sp. M19]